MSPEHSLGLVSRYNTVMSRTLTWHEWGLCTHLWLIWGHFDIFIMEIHVAALGWISSYGHNCNISHHWLSVGLSFSSNMTTCNKITTVSPHMYCYSIICYFQRQVFHTNFAMEGRFRYLSDDRRQSNDTPVDGGAIRSHDDVTNAVAEK